MVPRGLTASSLVFVAAWFPTVASSASVLKVIRKGIWRAEKEGRRKLRKQNLQTRERLLKGRLSTVDLLVLISLD